MILVRINARARNYWRIAKTRTTGVLYTTNMPITMHGNYRLKRTRYIRQIFLYISWYKYIAYRSDNSKTIRNLVSKGYLTITFCAINDKLHSITSRSLEWLVIRMKKLISVVSSRRRVNRLHYQCISDDMQLWTRPIWTRLILLRVLIVSVDGFSTRFFW